MATKKSGQTCPEEMRLVQRRERVARLYLEGKTQTEIAGELKVSQPTVSEDLAWVRGEWKKSAEFAFGDRVAEELARLDEVEREAWQAWERSKKKLKRVSTKTVKNVPEASKDPAVEREEETSVEEGRDGDPRHLNVVMDCIDKRCKILGLDAPLKVAPTTPDGKESWEPRRDPVVEQLLAEAASALKGYGVPVLDRYSNPPNAGVTADPNTCLLENRSPGNGRGSPRELRGGPPKMAPGSFRTNARRFGRGKPHWRGLAAPEGIQGYSASGERSGRYTRVPTHNWL